MTYGVVGFESRLPEVARPGHAEGDEDLFLGHVFQGPVGDGFENELEEVEAFSGVGKSLSGVKKISSFLLPRGLYCLQLGKPVLWSRQFLAVMSCQRLSPSRSL